MFIGDGAKLVRDCFALAKEKAPAIIFIDELDAVGTKRFDSEKSGDREVQRTMLELLNQLDGFSSDDRVKVLAATNRVDVLDPALLRSGRLDRKIEFPLPNEESRASILKIHSRKMTVEEGVNWQELARSTDEFGGAMLKAVCVEAGMIALRGGKIRVGHEHYVDAIAEVQAKKKDTVCLPLLRIWLKTSKLIPLLGQFLRIDWIEACDAFLAEGLACGLSEDGMSYSRLIIIKYINLLQGQLASSVPALHCLICLVTVFFPVMAIIHNSYSWLLQLGSQISQVIFDIWNLLYRVAIPEP